MKEAEASFQEFIDAIQVADDEMAFETVAARITRNLGFKWFAYLRVTNDTPSLISSYPKSWTGRYFDHAYQELDPVVRRARDEHDLFSWGGEEPKPAGTREQNRFFEEATTFGIRSGVTVPIRGGFGRMAAFTLATNDSAQSTKRLVAEFKNVVRLVGLYYHTHVTTVLRAGLDRPEVKNILTQRERQCLAWAAQGKIVADIAILVRIAPRTVVFHLENARRKLNAASIAQCVAEALRRGLLP